MLWEEYESVWDTLIRDSRPVVLYGTGNGADKIIDRLEKCGIEISGIFASTGFVRERTFRGYKVESYESICERLGEDINVLLCFGTTRGDVIEKIETVGKRSNLYIPDVPLYGGDVFDKEYLESHRAGLEAARELFDDESKKLFDDAVAFRMTGKGEFLRRVSRVSEPYEKLASERKVERVVDLGAYKGDTARLFASLPTVREVIAVEPDPKSFEKLCEVASEISKTALSDPESGAKVTALNFAASDRNGTCTYSASGSRGAGEEGKNRRAKVQTAVVKTLDSALPELFAGREDRPVDLIKFDVEGSELEALKGAAKTIESSRCALSVSLYHRTDDLFSLPLYISNAFPHLTRFSLYRPPCIPMWDLTLIAW